MINIKTAKALSLEVLVMLLATADGTPRKDRWKTVAFGLEMCGWRSSSGWRFTQHDIGHATFHVRQVFDIIGSGAHSSMRRTENPRLAEFAREALR